MDGISVIRVRRRGGRGAGTARPGRREQPKVRLDRRAQDGGRRRRRDARGAVAGAERGGGG
eukprot:5948178-Prymnesium_polylepis.2